MGRNPENSDWIKPSAGAEYFDKGGHGMRHNRDQMIRAARRIPQEELPEGIVDMIARHNQPDRRRK